MLFGKFGKLKTTSITQTLGTEYLNYQLGQKVEEIF